MPNHKHAGHDMTKMDHDAAMTNPQMAKEMDILPIRPFELIERIIYSAL